MTVLGPLICGALLVAPTAPATQVPVQRPTPVAPSAPTAPPPAHALVPDPGAPPPSVAEVPAAPPEATVPATRAVLAPDATTPVVTADASPPEVAGLPPTEGEPSPLSDVQMDAFDEDVQFDAQTMEDSRTATELTMARSMVAAGAVSAVAGSLMLITAAVERSKPACDFGQARCADAPRPAVANGLGVTGLVLALGGGALVTAGVLRKRRVRAGAHVDRSSASLTLRGRF